jgi:outer membrane lipoprotein-sorting protein
MRKLDVALPLAALLTALVAGPVLAETAEQKGLAIATEANRRDTGWKDSQVTMTMVLRNAQGQSSTRALRNKVLEGTTDGDKSLIVFDTPADVKGTALLSFTHKSGPDDQWLFLPALKRVKRIASDNKAGPFMGSEFAYEDLASQEVEKYTYKWLRDETLDGQKAFVSERYPVDPKSGYTRQVIWMDQAEYRPLKIEFYDRKATLMKTLVLSEYQQHLGRYWRAERLEMVNHQTGKSTTLTFAGFKFGTGLSERDFDQNALQNAK